MANTPPVIALRNSKVSCPFACPVLVSAAVPARRTPTQPMPPFKFELEHRFSFGAPLESAAEVIGPVPEGIRANVYCKGGDITGPKLKGRCRAVGGDWLTVRTDGVVVLDVRTTLETHDGALIATSYTGIGDLGPDG